jgi:hypothetical protein
MSLLSSVMGVRISSGVPIKKCERRVKMSDDIRLRVKYDPQDDITVLELAQCVKWLMAGIVEKKNWPSDEGWTRHFEVEDYDYGVMIQDTGKAIRDLMDDEDEDWFDEDDED